MALHYHDMTKSFNSGFLNWHSQAMSLLLSAATNSVSAEVRVTCHGSGRSFKYHAIGLIKRSEKIRILLNVCVS